jgi:hypothetical protein
LEDRTTPSSTAYLTSLYANLLHRAPAQADLAFWMPLLDNGMPASTVTAQIVASLEYQENVIRSSYQLFLNHNPSSSTVWWWAAQILSGTSDPQAEAMILASPEFVGDHAGDTSTWLNAVYEQVLGRPADAAGLAFWNGALQGGAGSVDVALAIVNSAEANSRVVTDAYHLLLGRTADAAALAYWDAVASQPQGPDLVLAGVASSAEYLNRASAGATGSVAGSGIGPFASEPYCADPYQFANLPTSTAQNGASAASAGGSSGSGTGSSSSNGIVL